MFRTRFVLIFVAILVTLLLGVAGFFWYQSYRSRGLELELVGPDQVLVGVPFKVQSNIMNSSGSILQDVQLSLSLPEGVAFLGAESGRIVEYKNLGNLGAGSLVKEEFELIVLSGENSVKQLETNVSYLPFALSSRFSKGASFDLMVRHSGLSLDIAGPTKIFSGEELNLILSLRNVSEIDFKNLKLQISYPPTFNFKNSTPKPDLGSNVWNLGDLRKGSEAQFAVRGSLAGPDNAFFDFKADAETSFLGQIYRIASRSATLSIAPSPLSLTISLNGNQDYIVYPGDELNYTLSYVNNNEIGLRDVIVKARLVGSMFDLATLYTGGVLRSLDNTIVWSAANIPGLAVLSPGASGSVTFSIKAKKTYPIKRLSDKNFTLKVEGQIESPTVPPFVAADKTLGVAILESKVGGRAQVDARALFRDAASGILNKGPLPLRVGQPTNFTIHWVITNFSTDIRDVEVKSFLGGNVRFTGVAKVSAGSAPIYNERTQEIIWKLDKIPATKGVLDKPLEAIFQVEVIPAIDQVGKFVTLMQTTALKAVDDFSGAELAATDVELTTALTDDPTMGAQQGVVVQ